MTLNTSRPHLLGPCIKVETSWTSLACIILCIYAKILDISYCKEHEIHICRYLLTSFLHVNVALLNTTITATSKSPSRLPLLSHGTGKLDRLKNGGGGGETATSMYQEPTYSTVLSSNNRPVACYERAS